MTLHRWSSPLRAVAFAAITLPVALLGCATEIDADNDAEPAVDPPARDRELVAPPVAPEPVPQPAAPARIAWAQDGARTLAVDAGNVYWTNDAVGYGAGGVVRAPKGGGNPARITRPLDLWQVAVAGDYIYWTDLDTHAVMRVAAGAAGAAPEKVAGDPAQPLVFAVRGDVVAFGSANGRVWVAPAAGGEARAVSGWPGVPTGIALDDDDVYWSTDGGLVLRAPRTGGEPTILAKAQHVPAGFVADDAALYWVDPDGRAVMSLSKLGDAPVAIATAQYRPAGIALHADGVYFTTQADGQVKRVAHGGGIVEVLATGQAVPADIAVDDSGVYWVTADDRAIWWLPRP